MSTTTIGCPSRYPFHSVCSFFRYREIPNISAKQSKMQNFRKRGRERGREVWSSCVGQIRTLQPSQAILQIVVSITLQIDKTHSMCSQFIALIIFHPPSCQGIIRCSEGTCVWAACNDLIPMLFSRSVSMHCICGKRDSSKEVHICRRVHD